MKRLLSLLVLLAAVSWGTWADETITVSANSEDISQAIDLKAVATLFGTAKNVEEFETLLNNPDSAFTNLDLNGDGVVDYLRVVETSADNKHLVVIQAVLAKDVFQDVASIYVEKDEATGQVTTQVVGDEYIYGTNYIIEPVYIYRPYIYDWFWSPYWTCWSSPWYWGYYPHWWFGWSCWPMHRYWDHCYHWHHHHPYCSFRYAAQPRPAYRDLHHTVARREYATRHSDRSFASRHAGATNARHLDASRSAAVRSSRTGAPSRQGSVAATRVGAPEAQHRQAGRADNTFGSAGVRRQASASSTRQAATRQQSAVSTRQTGSHTPVSSAQRSSSASVVRSSGATTPRSGSASVSRPAASTSTRSTTSQSVQSSRSSGLYSGSRSSGSYSGSRSSGSYSGSRSSGSYSGSSGHSSGGYSGGASRSSGGGFSGGGHSSGGGGGRSGGATRR